MGMGDESLERHEFHPRADFPVICAACGRHEHSLIHLVTPRGWSR